MSVRATTIQNVAFVRKRVPNTQSDKPGSSLVVAQTDSLIRHASSKTKRAIQSFCERHREVFESLRQAYADPDQWEPLLGTGKGLDRYRNLLAELQFHARGATLPRNNDVHRAIIEVAAKKTGVTKVEVDELRGVHPALLVDGSWKPMTVRIGTLAETANTGKSDDGYIAVLNALSRRLTPPVLEASFLDPKAVLKQLRTLRQEGRYGWIGLVGLREILLSPLKLFYELGDLGTTWLDAAGQPTAAFLEAVAQNLDRMGARRRTEIQNKFCEMSCSLKALGTSRKSVEKMAPAEQKMMMLAASTLAETSEDVSRWMDFLREPEKRKNPELIKEMNLKHRTPFDVAAWLVHRVSSGLNMLTDKNGWNQFSLRFEVGAGGGISGNGGKFSFGLIFPNLIEYRNGKATVKMETSLSSILWIKRDEITSRGGKSSVTLGPLGVRDSDFSQALNIKNELLLPVGFAFQTDKVMPPTVEGGYYMRLPTPPGTVNAKWGGDVGVLHPHLKGMEPFIRPLSNGLGTITEVLRGGASALWQSAGLDTATEVVKSGLRSAWHSAKSFVFRRPKPQPQPPRSVDLRTERLGRSASKVRKVDLALKLSKMYLRVIQKREAAGESWACDESFGYQELKKGCGEAESRRIIEAFLQEKISELSKWKTEIDALTEGPKRSPWEEFWLQNQLRSMSSKAVKVAERFKAANGLLYELFGPLIPMLPRDKPPKRLTPHPKPKALGQTSLKLLPKPGTVGEVLTAEKNSG